MTKNLRLSLHNSACVQHFTFRIFDKCFELSANDINLSLTHNMRHSSLNLATKLVAFKPTSSRNYHKKVFASKIVFHLLIFIDVLNGNMRKKNFAHISSRIKRANKASDTCSRFQPLIDSPLFEIHQSLCHFVLNFQDDKLLLRESL